MRLRKVLWVILGIVVVIGIAVGIWSIVVSRQSNKEQKALRNINVQALSNDNEKSLGTLIYGGAKLIGEITTENSNKVANLETTDSLDGAFNIYYQDLLNRYKNYEVSKKEITKEDAVGQKAKVIIVSGATGKITTTIWTKSNGMTQIEIVTSSDFK